MYYVIIDGEDGEPYLTETPQPGDEILEGPVDLREAEIALCRACNG